MNRRVYLFVPLILLGSLVFWRVYQKRVDLATQNAQRAARLKAAPVVSLATAEISDVVQTFQATGSVDSPQNVKIAPKVSGRIDFLELHEGDRVKKGQMLVRIDATEVEGQVQQAMAALAEAQYRLAQARITQNPSDVAVRTQVRQQKAGYASAQADYNQTVQNLKAQITSAKAVVRDAQTKVQNAKSGVNSAQANLDNATAKYNRILSLYTQGFIAAQDVDDAKAALAVQKANLEIANGQLDSAKDMKESADEQLKIVENKGSADVEASHARLVQAQASRDYAMANTAQMPAYQANLAALKATVAVDKAALTSSQARLRDTVLVSPLDGYVTGRYMDPGSMATPGQPILGVQFVHQVWVTISVPEEVYAKIHLGQPAKVVLDALPGRTFTGSVIQANPGGDPQSRQFTVRVILSNEENLFKPGMFGRVTLETQRVQNALVVPREAVQQDSFGSFVMLVDAKNTARRQPITAGADDVSKIAIEQGLRPGDKVVILSAFPVRDGQTVRPSGHKGPRGGARKGGAL